MASSTGPDRFISDKECVRLTNLSRTTLWELTRRGDFPGKYKLSARASRRKLSEVQAWIDSRKPA